MEAISAAESKFIADGVAQDFRLDGRSRSVFRPFFLEIGPIPQANGSARLLLGATHILACVKAELGSPLPDRPPSGRLEVAVDCSPTATPAFRGRGGDELAAELSSALQRSLCGGPDGSDAGRRLLLHAPLGLRQPRGPACPLPPSPALPPPRLLLALPGAALDLSLLLLEAKACWVLSLEVLLLNTEGNLLDACAIALKAALSSCVLPRVEVVMGEGGEDEPTLEVAEQGEGGQPVDTSKMPLTVTVARVGKHNIVDASPEEEAAASAFLTASIRPDGTITSMTKTGREGIHPSVLLEMLSEAQRTAAHLHKAVNDQLKELLETTD